MSKKHSIQDLVIDDLENRKDLGLSKYGTLLYPFNGRSSIQDAYEEVLDLACYLKQKMVEEELSDRKHDDSDSSDHFSEYINSYRFVAKTTDEQEYRIYVHKDLMFNKWCAELRIVYLHTPSPVTHLFLGPDGFTHHERIEYFDNHVTAVVKALDALENEVGVSVSLKKIMSDLTKPPAS